MSEKQKPVVLIDCDMVLLDFNQAIANAYLKAFGEEPETVDIKAFKASTKYGLDQLTTEKQEQLKKACAENDFWRTMPAMPGALEFTQKLAQHFELIVLTSMPVEHESTRMKNLLDLGFPVSGIVATSRIGSENPKKKFAEETNAVFFIDDLVKNFEGLNAISTKLVLLELDYSEGVNQIRDGIRVDHEITHFDQFWEKVFPEYQSSIDLKGSSHSDINYNISDTQIISNPRDIKKTKP